MRRRSDLADPGAMLSTTHELAGGGRVRIRLARPSDAREVARFLDELPANARGRRFDANAPAVRRMTFYDPRRRLVAAATIPGAGAERIVGLGDVALAADGEAELAVAVAERDRGVERLLAETLASLAVQRGATELKAPQPERNPPVVALLERLGPTVRTVEDGETVAYTRLRAA